MAATQEAQQQGQGPQQQRYELVSTLGKGGMAEVFLGWMHSVGGLRRKVAIKRILPELARKQSQLFEQMFVDEARLAFQLEHDNIVRVYDVGQSANTFFIVMEYVQGYDLKKIHEKLVERNQAMPLGVSLYIASQVASGLAYAHELTDDDGTPLGLVHNDISPPNILIGRHGEVKIADFGLSDARSNDVVTPEGMVKGKFAYISPESTRDPSLVSARSDIFSVGIVLWEIIAGRRLFQKDTDLDTFQAVRSCAVPDIRSFRPDVPPALVAILNRALAADPAQRYATSRELFLDLNRFSVEHGVALNRYQLMHMVNELAGGQWAEFIGERVTDAQQAELMNALGDMLPPGVAAHLKTFVTGGSVVDDVADHSFGTQEDWVADVFDDVGFDADDVGDFAADTATAAAAAPEVARPATPAPTAARTSSGATPVSSSSQRVAAAAAVATASVNPPTPLPMPPELDTGSGSWNTVNSGNHPAVGGAPASLEQAMAELQEQMKAQKLTFIVWGSVAGLLLGTVIGIVVGTLL